MCYFTEQYPRYINVIYFKAQITYSEIVIFVAILSEFYLIIFKRPF